MRSLRVSVMVALLFVGSAVGCGGSDSDESRSADDRQESSTTAADDPMGQTDGTEGEEVSSGEGGDLCEIVVGDEWEDALDLLPAELQDAFAEYVEARREEQAALEADPEAEIDPTPIPEDVLAYIEQECPDLVGGGDGGGGDGGEPTFTYLRFEGTPPGDLTWVVEGVCPDGSKPTDVEWLVGSAVEQWDEGPGNEFSTVASVNQLFDPDDPENLERTLSELGIPQNISGTCG